MANNGNGKPRVAVFKFASCDGCQLSVLNLESDLLAIAAEIEISYFPEASSTMLPGPYDLALVEGSITTAEEAERIKEVRKQSKFLITIGACSTTGGIQSLRNWADVDDYKRFVYASPSYIKTLRDCTPVAAHVAVDFALNGCPINKIQLLEVIAAFCSGRPPEVPTYSLCMECKRKGNVCVLVAQGQPCLGPITQAGCGALCPKYARGCFGCFGPMESANPDSLVTNLLSRGVSKGNISRLLRSFAGNAEVFRAAGEKLETIGS